MKVGIDTIGFYMPRYYLNLATLATARGVDFKKSYASLGLNNISVAPPNEDIVTMAASAAAIALSGENKEHIDTLLLATESVPLQLAVAVGTYTLSLLVPSLSKRVLPSGGELHRYIEANTGKVADITPETVLKKIWGR